MAKRLSITALRAMTNEELLELSKQKNTRGRYTAEANRAMSRLIDAGRLHREIMELAMAKDHVRIAKIINMVEIQPTVDVVPVKHGRWETRQDPVGDMYYMCSNCKEEISTVNGESPECQMISFCPYCGAKMDLEAAP